jgi:hypothetical protein
MSPALLSIFVRLVGWLVSLARSERPGGLEISVELDQWTVLSTTQRGSKS